MSYQTQRDEARKFAARIHALGFRVWIAADGYYGFISDETGSRVLSFAFHSFEDTLGGNYGPPSRESGTGWYMDETPQMLRNADDVRKALYAMPPPETRRNGVGWRNLTTVATHIKMYGPSSKFVEFVPTENEVA